MVDRHGPVVVLVEDDDGLRCALGRLLQASGFDARIFECAEDALQACRQAPVDCLVVDLHLPAMSGLALIDQLRTSGVRAPVVVISAHDEVHVRADLLRRGVSSFLGKPFLGTALIGALDRACSSR